MTQNQTPRAISSSTPLTNESNPMTTPANTPIANAILDLAALSVPTNYGASFKVKRLLTKVPVDKPVKMSYFRVRPGPEYTRNVCIWEDKSDMDTTRYVVPPHFAPILGAQVKLVQLRLAVDRAGNPRLVPITLPADDGTWNSWPQSLSLAMDYAEKSWIRLESNRSTGTYDIFEAQSELGEPIFPDASFDELFQVAFRGKLIADESHPVVQALQGRV